MSGETELNVSGWTTDTLREFILSKFDDQAIHYEALVQEKFARLLALLAEKDLRDSQRFDAQQHALRDALGGAERAVNAAMAAAQQAVAKAESAAEKRFDAVNEFRAQLSDQAATFMPRNEATVMFSSLGEKFEGFTKRQDALGQEQANVQGRSTGLADGWGYLALGVGMLVGFAGIILAIVR